MTGAFKERLLREIMRADGCSYSQAYRVLGMMNTTNESLQNYYKLPYLIGIGTAVSGGILSIPVVFHQGTAVWFCETFVLEEVPDLAELDTFWKVGAWTWTWMEPAIGTASFVLLSMQLIRSVTFIHSHAAPIDVGDIEPLTPGTWHVELDTWCFCDVCRSQMKKIQMKPYIGRVMTWKADALCEGFPQYEREIVRDYAKADLWGLESNRARGGYPANSVFPIDR